MRAFLDVEGNDGTQKFNLSGGKSGSTTNRCTWIQVETPVMTIWRILEVVSRGTPSREMVICTFLSRTTKLYMRQCSKA